MATSINIIPELNYWIRRELKNSELNDTFSKIPITISEYWRDPNSVIELLFNETYDWSGDPETLEEDVTPYNYAYKKANILKIEDKTINNRIMLYRWNANIYVTDDESHDDLFDLDGVPGEYLSNMGDSIYFTFSEMTLDMLDRLWKYKSVQEVDINGIIFNDLDSDLAKLIYIYLDAFINDTFSHYNDGVVITNDSSDILSSLYEKHIIDVLYILKQKSYGIEWRETQLINDRLVEIEEDIFIILNKVVSRVRLNSIDVLNGEYVISDIPLPWNRKDFTFFKDGKILVQDTDYKIERDVSDVSNITSKVKFLRDDFQSGELIKFIYSTAIPHSAYSQDDINLIYNVEEDGINDNLMTATRGDDFTININCQRVSGPVDISGWELWFTVRDSIPEVSTIDDADALISKTDIVEFGEDGLYNWIIPSDDMDIALGVYYYDIQSKDVYGTIRTLASGQIKILPDITRGL